MKVGKHLIGKVVEIQWCDPNSDRVPMDGLLKGRAALATWKEYGVVHDVTDNVVLLIHSAASNAGSRPDDTDEVLRTALHEALIERIRVFESMKEEA